MNHASAPSRAAWLGDTAQLQCVAPTIRSLSWRLTARLRGAHRKAVECHDYVRSLPFALALSPALPNAVEVARQGHGDAAAKTLLLVSLMRSAGLPARVRVRTLPGTLFEGLFDESMQPFHHVCAEVQLDGVWQAFDTHVLDPEYANAARERLRQEGRVTGYLVHRGGAAAWDGRRNAFCQYDEQQGAVVTDLGAHDDFAGFEAACFDAAGACKEGSWTLAALIANRKVRQMRLDAAATLQTK